ncbi:sulfate transporter N-terminal domain with GLY motif-domain-containing protein [Zopfochytrium polystomum]|nr:sulfate transporter N-terminal domain with GLY motif-domain-containing protein [Zopfochytrium polystomum]
MLVVVLTRVNQGDLTTQECDRGHLQEQPRYASKHCWCCWCWCCCCRCCCCSLDHHAIRRVSVSSCPPCPLTWLFDISFSDTNLDNFSLSTGLHCTGLAMTTPPPPPNERTPLAPRRAAPTTTATLTSSTLAVAPKPQSSRPPAIASLAWLPRYRPSFFAKDATAGVTIATLVIPQAMAYAVLASLPPVYGLYAAIFPGIIYAFFGPSAFQNIGPFAVIAMMISQTSSSAFEWIEQSQVNATQTAAILPVAMVDFESISQDDPSLATYISIVMLLSFLVGLLQFLLWAFGGGNRITVLLPDHLVSGFMVGSAFCIGLTQIKYILGVKVPSFNGTFNFFRTVWALLNALPKTSLAAILVAVATFGVLSALHSFEIFARTQYNVWMEKRARRWQQIADDASAETGVPQPSPKPQQVHPICDVILTIAIFAFTAYLFNWKDRFGIAIIGPIPAGLPPPKMPWTLLGQVPVSPISLVLQMLPGASLIGIVCFVTAYSVTRSFGTYSDFAMEDRCATDEQGAISQSLPSGTRVPYPPSQYSTIANQDLLALAVASMFGSFFSAHLPSGSVSRSAILAGQTDSRTPLNSLVASATVALVICLIGIWFETVPLGCLAVIVIVALKSVLLRVRVGWELGRTAVLRAHELRESHAKEQLLEATHPAPASDLNEPSGRTNISVDESHAQGQSSSSHSVASAAAHVGSPGAPTSSSMKSVPDSAAADVPPSESRRPSPQWSAYLQAAEPGLIWWLTFLGVIVLDAGSGILLGISVVALFALLLRR